MQVFSVFMEHILNPSLTESQFKTEVGIFDCSINTC